MKRSQLASRLVLGVTLLTSLVYCWRQIQVEATRPTIWPEARDDAAQTLHRNDLDRIAKGPIDLLFLGDSITEGWYENRTWRRYYEPRNAANFGIGGDRTQHVLWRIDHGALSGIEPRVVVLLIGTNNIGYDPVDQIADGVAAILDRIDRRLPSTQVLLLGVFPRGASRNLNQPFDTPDPRVTELNQRLAQFAQRERVTFLDFSDSFLNPDGTIPRELMPDFLHLSQKGYRIWAEVMEPVLAELLMNTIDMDQASTSANQWRLNPAGSGTPAPGQDPQAP